MKALMTKRNAKLHCCPLCGSKVLKLHSSAGDDEDEDGEMLLEPGEPVGVVFSEVKTGCYDWAHVVVGIVCDKGHVFWIPSDLPKENVENVP